MMSQQKPHLSAGGEETRGDEQKRQSDGGMRFEWGTDSGVISGDAHNAGCHFSGRGE